MVHIIGLPNAKFAENTRPNRPHPLWSEENITTVTESVRLDLDESLPFSTVWLVICNNLAYFA